MIFNYYAILEGTSCEEMKQGYAEVSCVELTKLSDEMTITPDILSNRQVAQLVCVISDDSQEKMLVYEEFIQWLGLVALLGLNRAPFANQFPTAMLKVEYVLMKLSKSKMLRVIQMHTGAKGSSRADVFTTQMIQKEASEQAELTRLANQDIDDASMTMMDALQMSENQENMASIFEYYCNYAEQDLKSTMSSTQFYRLMRDCYLEDESTLNRARIDLLFQQATRGVRKARMTLAQLFEAVKIVSSIKYSDVQDSSVAVQTLLREQILPYAHRLEALPSHVELIDSPEVQALIDRADAVLKDVYEYYIKVSSAAVWLPLYYWCCCLHTKLSQLSYSSSPYNQLSLMITADPSLSLSLSHHHHR